MQEVSSARKLDRVEERTECKKYADSCRPERNSFQPHSNSVEISKVKPVRFSDSERHLKSTCEPRNDRMQSKVKETHNEIKNRNTFNNLSSMKNELRKTYGEIKEDKPPNSPNIAKWFDNGGSLRINNGGEKKAWTYVDNVGRSVKYIDGYPVFPKEAKHKVIEDISIDMFTGDRNQDKKTYLEKLEKLYGLTEIPDGYDLHHDYKNGNMQLVKTEWHKKFTHTGGHSIYKEGQNANF